MSSPAEKERAGTLVCCHNPELPALCSPTLPAVSVVVRDFRRLVGTNIITVAISRLPVKVILSSEFTKLRCQSPTLPHSIHTVYYFTIAIHYITAYYPMS